MQEWIELAAAAAASAGVVYAVARATRKPAVYRGPEKPPPLKKALMRIAEKSDIVRITLPSGEIGTVLLHDDGYATDFDPSVLDEADFLPQAGRKTKKWNPE